MRPCRQANRGGGLTLEQRERVGDAEESRTTRNLHVSKHLGVRGFELVIEEKVDVDPVFAHAREIGPDFPIAFGNGHRSILIFGRRRPRDLDELIGRMAGLGRRSLREHHCDYCKKTNH